MGKLRARYNEKARASGATGSSKPHPSPRDGGRKKLKPTTLAPADPNAEILVPGGRDEAAIKYNEEAAQPQMSNKRKKRMEKYVEKKIKKEGRKHLFDQLSANSWSSDLLKSSRTLGQNKETKGQKLKRALLEERHGMERSDKDVRLYVERKASNHDDYDDEDDDDEDDGSDESDSDIEMHDTNSGQKNGKAAALKKPVLTGTVTYHDDSEVSSSPAQESTPSTSTPAVPIVAGGALKAGVVKSTVKKAAPKKMSRIAIMRAQKEAEQAKKNQQPSHQDRESSFDSSDSDNDSSGSESDKEEEEEGDNEPAKKKRRGWMTDLGGMATNAEDQEGELIVSNLDNLPVVPEGFFEPRTGPATDLLGNTVQALKPIEEGDAIKPFHVKVDRTPEIQEVRLKLPVCTEEQHIMEMIYYNDIILIKGETGSGKTTQVPQFLYEAGYGHPDSNTPGMIGITQPRRVAAVAMAERVATEMNVSSSIVSHQVRYDATTSKETVMKFMTDGVLLREMNADFMLTKYSVIIIDEAHERSLNTDILIGALSRIVRTRREEFKKDRDVMKPLKLIIMSATLVISEFTKNERLFGDSKAKAEAAIAAKAKEIADKEAGVEQDSDDDSSEEDEATIKKRRREAGLDEDEVEESKDLVPVVSVDVKKVYGVTMHFNKKTPDVDYVTEAFKKVSKIHTKLPEGAILVFLSGQAEITLLVKQLKKKFPVQKKVESKPVFETKLDARNKRKHGSSSTTTDTLDESKEEATREELNPRNEDVELEDIEIGEVDEATVEANNEMDDEDEAFNLEGSDSEEELMEGDEVLEETPDAGTAPLHVLPLYSMLKTEDQMRVFAPPPEGHRLCVVATNVAETSITIPGIRYVVDSGKSKERHYDPETGIQTFQVGWTSKASSIQRAGRAGRTGPGHCYRLYSSAVFENEFEESSKAEILKMPIDGVVLQMKSMFIDNVVNFPFPTPPPKEDLRQAEQRLVYMGALSKSTRNPITDLGKTMSIFPLVPRLSRMLAMAGQFDCYQYVIAIVAALSVGEIFIKEFQLDISRPGETDDESEGSDDDQQTKSRYLLDDLDEMELMNIKNEKELKKQKRKITRRKFYKAQAVHEQLDPLNDMAKVLSVVAAYGLERSKGNEEKFCSEYFVRLKAMQEIHQLRGQLTRMMQHYFPTEAKNISLDPNMGKPTEKQLTAIRQMVACAFVDQLAIRKDLIVPSEASFRGKKSTKGVPYLTMWSKESCFIHPSSGLYGITPTAPDFLIYQDLQRTVRPPELNDPRPAKVYLKGLTAVQGKWIATLAKNTGLVRSSKEQLKSIGGDVKISYQDYTIGPNSWPLSTGEVWYRQVQGKLVPMSNQEINTKKNEIRQKAKSRGG